VDGAAEAALHAVQDQRQAEAEARGLRQRPTAGALRQAVDAAQGAEARLQAVRAWAMRTHRGAAAQEILAILDRKETP